MYHIVRYHHVVVVVVVAVNLTCNVFLQRFREEQDDVILNAVGDIFSPNRSKVDHIVPLGGFVSCIVLLVKYAMFEKYY